MCWDIELKLNICVDEPHAQAFNEVKIWQMSTFKKDVICHTNSRSKKKMQNSQCKKNIERKDRKKKQNRDIRSYVCLLGKITINWRRMKKI